MLTSLLQQKQNSSPSIEDNKTEIKEIMVKCEKCDKQFACRVENSSALVDEAVKDLTRQLLEHDKSVHSDNQKTNNSALLLQKQVDILTQLLVSFQTQIQELEKKISNKGSNPELEGQLGVLKKQFQRVENKLVQEQNKLTSSTSTNISQTQNKDKFNWLLVAVPLGLAVILGIIIFAFRRKKSKKE